MTRSDCPPFMTLRRGNLISVSSKLGEPKGLHCAGYCEPCNTFESYLRFMRSSHCLRGYLLRDHFPVVVCYRSSMCFKRKFDVHILVHDMQCHTGPTSPHLRQTMYDTPEAILIRYGVWADDITCWYCGNSTQRGTACLNCSNVNSKSL